MDPIDRRERINELRQRAAEGRARIAERELQRERDPARALEHAIAEHAQRMAAGKPRGGVLAGETPLPGVITKDYRENPLDHAPRAATMASEAYPPFDDFERGVTFALGEVYKDLKAALTRRDQRLNTLESEVVALKRRIRELSQNHRAKRNAK
jgi:hypothetical protein